MDDLVRSIKTRGILEPVLVRRVAGRFELVAGERRLQAAQRLGMKEVPVIIVELDDKESLEVALVENVQREDLNPVDEAQAYLILNDEFGYTHDQIAERVGKDRSTVSNLLRLLKLPEEVRGAIVAGTLTSGHARALLSLPRPKDQIRWARRMIQRAWSVREAEARIAEATRPAGMIERKRRPVPLRDPHLSRVEEAIRRRVGSDVHLAVNRKGGGTLELRFADQQDLERILDLLGVQVH